MRIRFGCYFSSWLHCAGRICPRYCSPLRRDAANQTSSSALKDDRSPASKKTSEARRGAKDRSTPRAKISVQNEKPGEKRTTRRAAEFIRIEAEATRRLDLAQTMANNGKSWVVWLAASLVVKRRPSVFFPRGISRAAACKPKANWVRRVHRILVTLTFVCLASLGWGCVGLRTQCHGAPRRNTGDHSRARGLSGHRRASLRAFDVLKQTIVQYGTVRCLKGVAEPFAMKLKRRVIMPNHNSELRRRQRNRADGERWMCLNSVTNQWICLHPSRR